MLGDVIEAALSSVGITKGRVESWLGRPCGCKERQERLNALSSWAIHTITANGTGKSKEYFDSITNNQ